MIAQSIIILKPVFTLLQTETILLGIVVGLLVVVAFGLVYLGTRLRYNHRAGKSGRADIQTGLKKSQEVERGVWAYSELGIRRNGAALGTRTQNSSQTGTEMVATTAPALTEAELLQNTKAMKLGIRLCRDAIASAARDGRHSIETPQEQRELAVLMMLSLVKESYSGPVHLPLGNTEQHLVCTCHGDSCKFTCQAFVHWTNAT